MKSQEPVLLTCTSVRQQLEHKLSPCLEYIYNLVSIRTDLSGDLLHSPDHWNVVRIEYADAFDVISRNDKVVVLPGGPVVAEGHVLVVGEEELGICIRVCHSLTTSVLCIVNPHMIVVLPTFALIPLAGNFAKDAAGVVLGHGGAGARVHQPNFAHGSSGLPADQ